MAAVMWLICHNAMLCRRCVVVSCRDFAVASLANLHEAAVHKFNVTYTSGRRLVGSLVSSTPLVSSSDPSSRPVPYWVPGHFCDLPQLGFAVRKNA